MKNNPLLKLEAFGQSIWIDFIRRGTISSGELKKLIDEDGVTGVTSNPSIFEKAIGGSGDYDEAIQALADKGKSVEQVYESLGVEVHWLCCHCGMVWLLLPNFFSRIRVKQSRGRLSINTSQLLQ